ncbi:MAG: hypothetical protein BWY83_02066 [bacterium ADurb.Bin478]|nr:MAG: hypothetical protein BWY83_02066 [bacterium ADurb.Bin478]
MMYPLNEKERQMRKFPALMMALMSGVVLNLACAPAKTRTVLWNGTNFDGWVRYVPDQTVQVDTVWTSQDGVLRCSGKPTGYIRTRASFSDYHLHLEWRWVKEGGNSGVLLHCQGPDQVWPHCIEAQLKSGDAGDLVLIGPGEITVAGKTYKNDRPFLIIANQKDDIENPVGEWNSYDIVCRGQSIICSVNGVEVNRGEKAFADAGPIALQSEGAAIEFRAIWLEK